ncbi:MAG: PrgI family protein [Patescibacteria group bacterium]
MANGGSQQFVVPQFIDVEAKIIGPITGRQFVIMLITLGLEFIIYAVFLNIIIVILLGLPVLVLGCVVAFARVNGQPFHYIILNMVQTLRKPSVRVWDKGLTDAQIRQFVKKEEAPPPPPPPTKASLASSRLGDLSLVVNTGGVYQPEDEI